LLDFRVRLVDKRFQFDLLFLSNSVFFLLFFSKSFSGPFLSRVNVHASGGKIEEKDDGT
jgi:hypothetical protein